MSLFKLENLTIRYGEREAIGGVDLEIAAGRITALIGPSGCGKTSLLSSLNRLTDLLPRCRVEGTLEFAGIDVLDPALDTVALRRRVGMIFQKPIPFPLSIRRNLEIGLEEHGLGNRRTRPQLIEEALREVGLFAEVKDRLDHPAHLLSGGQQQRLCIARALILRPEVLLMDEPCSALDPLSSGVVEDLILALRERVSVVIVTHNLAQARRIADDVAFFWSQGGAGRLIEKGPCTSLFEQPGHELTEAYVRGRRGGSPPPSSRQPGERRELLRRMPPCCVHAGFSLCWP